MLTKRSTGIMLFVAWSMFVFGLGFSIRQVVNVFSFQDPQPIAKVDAKDIKILRPLATGIEDKTPKPEAILEIEVDYDQPLKNVIAAGQYDQVNEDITEVNFPAAALEKGKRRVVFRLFHIDQYTFGEDLVKEIKRQRCRPATFRELLAFGKANPRQSGIIALDAIWHTPRGVKTVVAIYGSGLLDTERSLSLNYGEWEKPSRGSWIREGILLRSDGTQVRLKPGFAPSFEFLAVEGK